MCISPYNLGERAAKPVQLRSENVYHWSGMTILMAHSLGCVTINCWVIKASSFLTVLFGFEVLSSALSCAAVL